MTGFKPAELENLLEMPNCFRAIWAWFLDLNSTRPAGFGVSSITFTEMQSYFNLMGIEPESWEIGILRLFDNIACQEFSKQQKKQEKAQQARQKK